jgi:peptidoglycan/LPS O-acetylase OafA/YrhL
VNPGLANKPVLVYIQLLRAIAVLMVFGFHLNLPGFTFGFLGVDVFFVISGFLMMKIYSTLKIKNVKQFYLKRFLRLTPAYLVVSLLTTFIFFTRVLPYEKISLVTQNFYANLLASNFYYWTENQYFVNSGLRPLLTFWSLALEIQFYLILPFVFLLMKKTMKLLVFITFLSFVLFIVLETISPETGFFLLPGRLWEFLVGVHLASFLDTYNKKFRISTFTFRIILITFPVFILIIDLMEVEKSLIFNVFAVVYTLILLFLGFHWQENRNLLNDFGLVIGKYSYSIYLVHLPIISLVYYKPFSDNVKFGSDLKLNLVSILLVAIFSFVLFNVVEQPFRGSGAKNLIYLHSFALLIAVVLLLTIPYFKNIGSDSMIRKISFSQEDRSIYRCGTFNRIEILHKLMQGPESCLLSSKVIGERFLLVGNSHADSIDSALNSKLESAGNTLYILRNPLALNVSNLDLAKQEVINREIDVVIYHSSSGQLNKLVFDDFVEFVHKEGKRLIIIGPVPIYDKSVPASVYKNYLYSEPLGLKTLQFFQNLFREEVYYYRQLANSSRTIYFNSLEVFCTPTCQLIDIGNENLLYFDSSHLTNTGATFLLKDFENTIIQIIE